MRSDSAVAVGARGHCRATAALSRLEEFGDLTATRRTSRIGADLDDLTTDGRAAVVLSRLGATTYEELSSPGAVGSGGSDSTGPARRTERYGRQEEGTRDRRAH
jgi:hypothetical protein